ncbi:MAG: nitrilase-related carbon-nitrogen hydrolase, partial [Gemmatirosa sp.]
MTHRPLTLALVQFRPVKGEYDANVARIGALLADCAALEPRPDVVQLPETAPSGYFVEGGVRELAVTAGTLARDLDVAYRAASRERGRAPDALDVVIGFYEVWQDTLYNSALYLSVGDAPDVPGWRIRYVHRKHFLPTYGLFDEERFVERGLELRAFPTPWGRAAILVCEDAWHSLTGTIAALDGAQVVFVCSAAPARGAWPRGDNVPGPASVARWERLVRDIAEEHGVFVALANLVGSEGGKSFGGSSTVCGPKGDVRVRAPVFAESIVSITLDLGDLARARADAPMLNDLRVAMPHLLRMLDAVQRGEPAAVVYDPATRANASHGLVRADESSAPAGSARGTPDVGSPGAQVSASVPDGDEGMGGQTAPRAGSRADAPTGAARGAPPERQDTAAAAIAPHRPGAPRIAITQVALADHGHPPALA